VLDAGGGRCGHGKRGSECWVRRGRARRPGEPKFCEKPWGGPQGSRDLEDGFPGEERNAAGVAVWPSGLLGFPTRESRLDFGDIGGAAEDCELIRYDGWSRIWEL